MCRSRRVKVFMGDTATSVNQGGASGSTGIQDGGKQMRVAAAEARRVLVEMAADKLGLPADQLDGDRRRRPRRAPMPAKKVSYAELIGGAYFNVHLDWNGNTAIRSTRPARRKPKDPKDHKIVGQPIKREDIAPKVFAQEDFCTDIKVPGMVHGRMIRPAVAGAVPVKVDESSIKDIPAAKVVWDKGFLGVVADKEWDAIKASRTAQGRMVGCRRRRSPIRPRSTITSATRRRANARSKARKPAMSTTRSRPPRA